MNRPAVNRSTASAVLSAFLFAQGLLGVAGLAAVIMHRHAADVTVASVSPETVLR